MAQNHSEINYHIARNMVIPHSGAALPRTSLTNDAADMLRHARAYAKYLGWYVFPLHNAIFDANGNCTGCSCEHYRRSETCQKDHPGLYLGPTGKCDWPGKCPRVKWSEKSTIDRWRIDKWWGKSWRDTDVETGEIVFNIPNIGIDCRKSNLLVLDADKYKKFYGDLSSLLSWQDRATVTALTQGGGEHLIYDRQGKPYGNATGNLPPGIDIRGVGGFIVAVPSIGKSGRRYQYEEAYKPSTTPLLPIPAGLDAILSKAHNTTEQRSVVSTVERHTSPPTPAEARADKWLLEQMFRSKYGDKIRRLYNGITTDYATPSEADLGFCGHLKFFTGNNSAWVDRLFRQSGLYRDKWEQPDSEYGTYGQRTIARAKSGQTYRGVVR